MEDIENLRDIDMVECATKEETKSFDKSFKDLLEADSASFTEAKHSLIDTVNKIAK